MYLQLLIQLVFISLTMVYLRGYEFNLVFSGVPDAQSVGFFHVLYNIVCLSSFHWATVLSVLLFMDLGYAFGVFKLLFRCVSTISPTQRVVLLRNKHHLHITKKKLILETTQFLFRGIDFASVSAILRLDFGIFLMV